MNVFFPNQFTIIKRTENIRIKRIMIHTRQKNKIFYVSNNQMSLFFVLDLFSRASLPLLSPYTIPCVTVESENQQSNEKLIFESFSLNQKNQKNQDLYSSHNGIKLIHKNKNSVNKYHDFLIPFLNRLALNDWETSRFVKEMKKEIKKLSEKKNPWKIYLCTIPEKENMQWNKNDIISLLGIFLDKVEITLKLNIHVLEKEMTKDYLLENIEMKKDETEDEILICEEFEVDSIGISEFERMNADILKLLKADPRVAAMHLDKVIKYAPMDVLATEYWQQLIPVFQNILAFFPLKQSEKLLIFVTELFDAGIGTQLGDVFLLFSGALDKMVLEYSFLTIDISNFESMHPRARFLLNCAQLLIKMLRLLPEHWSNFPNVLLYNIHVSILKLVLKHFQPLLGLLQDHTNEIPVCLLRSSFCHESTKIVKRLSHCSSFFALVCFLDPGSTWFDSWLQHAAIRNIFFSVASNTIFFPCINLLFMHFRFIDFVLKDPGMYSVCLTLLKFVWRSLQFDIGRHAFNEEILDVFHFVSDCKQYSDSFQLSRSMEMYARTWSLNESCGACFPNFRNIGVLNPVYLHLHNAFVFILAITSTRIDKQRLVGLSLICSGIIECFGSFHDASVIVFVPFVLNFFGNALSAYQTFMTNDKKPITSMKAWNYVLQMVFGSIIVLGTALVKYEKTEFEVLLSSSSQIDALSQVCLTFLGNSLSCEHDSLATENIVTVDIMVDYIIFLFQMNVTATIKENYLQCLDIHETNQCSFLRLFRTIGTWTPCNTLFHQLLKPRLSFLLVRVCGTSDLGCHFVVSNSCDYLIHVLYFSIRSSLASQLSLIPVVYESLKHIVSFNYISLCVSRLCSSLKGTSALLLSPIPFYLINFFRVFVHMVPCKIDSNHGSAWYYVHYCVGNDIVIEEKLSHEWNVALHNQDVLFTHPMLLLQLMLTSSELCYILRDTDAKVTTARKCLLELILRAQLFLKPESISFCREDVILIGLHIFSALASNITFFHVLIKCGVLKEISLLSNVSSEVPIVNAPCYFANMIISFIKREIDMHCNLFTPFSEDLCERIINNKTEVSEPIFFQQEVLPSYFPSTTNPLLDRVRFELDDPLLSKLVAIAKLINWENFEIDYQCCSCPVEILAISPFLKQNGCIFKLVTLATLFSTSLAVQGVLKKQMQYLDTKLFSTFTLSLESFAVEKLHSTEVVTSFEFLSSECILEAYFWCCVGWSSLFPSHDLNVVRIIPSFFVTLNGYLLTHQIGFQLLSDHFEAILKYDNASIYSCFVMAGFSPKLVAFRWWSCFFFNMIGLSAFIKLFELIVSKGAHFLVYFSLSLLSNMQSQIKYTVQYGSLLQLLLNQPLVCNDQVFETALAFYNVHCDLFVATIKTYCAR